MARRDGVTITRTVTLNVEELELAVEAIVRPPRPAPACSNPDSPAYSDAGDPGELEAVRLDLTLEQEQAIRRLYGKIPKQVDLGALALTILEAVLGQELDLGDEGAWYDDVSEPPEPPDDDDDEDPDDDRRWEKVESEK